jgi:hypothetical protein
MLLAVAVAAASTLTASPSVAEPEVTPTSVPQAVRLAPASWCRPVTNAAVDPSPLACWLHLAAEEPEMPPAMQGMNFGDLPAWSTVDLEAITAEIERYEARLEAERRAEEARIAAERAERERIAAERARPERPPAAGDTCGVRPGDFPTDEQLACMFGTTPDAGGSDEEFWPEGPEDYPPPADYEFEPRSGPNTLPPPPPGCMSWWYDSETGYTCHD